MAAITRIDFPRLDCEFILNCFGGCEDCSGLPEKINAEAKERTNQNSVKEQTMNAPTARRTAVSVDAMVAGDWPDVSAIFLEGIATGNATFETLAPTWEQWDRAHLPVARLVARSGRTIAGWAALSRVSQRSCYAGVAEMSVYVATWARGQGVGDALMKAGIKASEEAGIWSLQGAIFPENTASLRLCEANGFRVVGRREKIGKRDGVWRDTVLVERRSKRVGID